MGTENRRPIANDMVIVIFFFFFLFKIELMHRQYTIMKQLDTTHYTIYFKSIYFNKLL